MQNFVKKQNAAVKALVKNPKVRAAVAGFAAMGMTVQEAAAALPAAIGTQLTQVQADGLALADLVWPVVITLFGALVLFKLFKRFGSQI